MKFQLFPKNKSTKKKTAILQVIAFLFLFLLILLSIACVWALREYSNISLEEILFYLSMPLQGTARGFTRDLVLHVFLPTAVICFVIFLLAVFPIKKVLALVTRKHKIQILPLRIPVYVFPILIVWMVLLYTKGNGLLDISGFIGSRIHQSTLIEERYADPSKVALTFPQKKRNLITIYIESGESTMQDREHGGVSEENWIPEMTLLEEKNISFSQNDLYAGAAVAPACGWTIAGMVAQTAGIPLKFYKYDNHGLSADNMGNDLVRFLPGATMLGDILEDEGYHTVFLCGSDFDFGGRTKMYAQHGHYDIEDYYHMLSVGKLPEDYYYGWGFEDKKLYAFAKERLLELEEEDQPFHLGLLTVDTHFPGYTCEICENWEGNDTYKSIRCSSLQLYDFIEWCKAQDFFEDTTIVVTGDHVSMDKALYDVAGEYNRHLGSSSRFVYNCFINAQVEPVKVKNRKFTTLDFFPSVLAAMGVTIDGDQLGLGVNLFSDKETLSEELGYDVFFDELNRKSLYYDSKLLR